MDGWVNGKLDAWVNGKLDGWMGGCKTVLRVAYSNLKELSGWVEQ